MPATTTTGGQAKKTTKGCGKIQNKWHKILNSKWGRAGKQQRTHVSSLE